MTLDPKRQEKHQRFFDTVADHFKVSARATALVDGLAATGRDVERYQNGTGLADRAAAVLGMRKRLRSKRWAFIRYVVGLGAEPRTARQWARRVASAATVATRPTPFRPEASCLLWIEDLERAAAQRNKEAA